MDTWQTLDLPLPAATCFLCDVNMVPPFPILFVHCSNFCLNITALNRGKSKPLTYRLRPSLLSRLVSILTVSIQAVFASILTIRNTSIKLYVIISKAKSATTNSMYKFRPLQVIFNHTRTLRISILTMQEFQSICHVGASCGRCKPPIRSCCPSPLPWNNCTSRLGRSCGVSREKRRSCLPPVAVPGGRKSRSWDGWRHSAGGAAAAASGGAPELGGQPGDRRCQVRILAGGGDDWGY